MVTFWKKPACKQVSLWTPTSAKKKTYKRRRPGLGSEDISKRIKAAATKKFNPYAQSYIDALPRAEKEYGKDGLKSQLAYIKNNLKDKKASEEVNKLIKELDTE